MAFSPWLAQLLAAERFEREHRARISTLRAGREAVQEVKARRDLGYPPLCQPLRKDKRA